MHRATAELKATGIEDAALKVGERAPSFILFNQDRVEVASTDLLSQGPLVISFFRAFCESLIYGTGIHLKWSPSF